MTRRRRRSKSLRSSTRAVLDSVTMFGLWGHVRPIVRAERALAFDVSKTPRISRGSK